MTRNNSLLILFAGLLVSLTVGAAACSSVGGRHAVFKSRNGDVVELDTRTGTIHTPHSQGAVLDDCSNKFQTCLTDHHGFAFAYFRKCTDAEIGDYKRLRFHPRILVDLHNNLWMVFDAAPNYMFHYVIPKGIVGIYVGATPSYDFRSLFHDRSLQMEKFDELEYHITASSDAIAACSE